jgi:hypothetical protein
MERHGAISNAYTSHRKYRHALRASQVFSPVCPGRYGLPPSLCLVTDTDGPACLDDPVYPLCGAPEVRRQQGATRLDTPALALTWVSGPRWWWTGAR